MTDTAASPAAESAARRLNVARGPLKRPHLRGPDVSFPVGGKPRPDGEGEPMPAMSGTRDCPGGAVKKHGGTSFRQKNAGMGFLVSVSFGVVGAPGPSGFGTP